MPRTNKSFELLPLAVTRALADLGPAMRTARIRRRLSMASAAERIGVSVPTLRKLEQGEPGVSVATLCCALWLYGLLDPVLRAAAPDADTLGQALEAATRPQRVRSRGDDDF